MTETETYAISIDQLGPNGQKLLAFAQENPVKFGLVSCLVVAGVATFVVPLAMSVATNASAGQILAAAANVNSKCHSQSQSRSDTPPITASTFLTILQAMTTTGTLVSQGGSLINAGALAADWAKGVDWAKGADWAKGVDWAGWAQAAGQGSGDLVRSVAGLGKEADRAAGGAVWAVNEAAKGADWAAGEAVKRVGNMGRLLSRL